MLFGDRADQVIESTYKECALKHPGSTNAQALHDHSHPSRARCDIAALFNRHLIPSFRPRPPCPSPPLPTEPPLQDARLPTGPQTQPLLQSVTGRTESAQQKRGEPRNTGARVSGRRARVPRTQSRRRLKGCGSQCLRCVCVRIFGEWMGRVGPAAAIRRRNDLDSERVVRAQLQGHRPLLRNRLGT